MLETAEARALNNALLTATEEHEEAVRALSEAETRLAELEARLAALPPRAREEG